MFRKNYFVVIALICEYIQRIRVNYLANSNDIKAMIEFANNALSPLTKGLLLEDITNTLEDLYFNTPIKKITD
jgi:hypothetical protein